MRQPTFIPNTPFLKRFTYLSCLLLFFIPLAGFSQNNTAAQDTSLTVDAVADLRSIMKEVRAINSQQLQVAKTLNEKDVLNSVSTTTTKTFYSTKKGSLLKVIIKEVRVAKNTSQNAAISQTYYFKDENLICFVEKSSLRPHSTTDAYFKNGRPLAITKSSMSNNYLVQAKKLLKEFN